MPIHRRMIDTSPIRLGLSVPKRRRSFSAAELAQISREIREECPAPGDPPPGDPPSGAAPAQAAAQAHSSASERTATSEQSNADAAAPASAGARMSASPDSSPPRHRASGAGSGDNVGVGASGDLHRLERRGLREACNWLELSRICRKARCRKAGRCRGEPLACLRAGLALAPEPAREFVRSMMQARDLGLSFEEAFEDAADCHDGYFAWLDGLRAANFIR
jgi:hypothetical protein